MANKKETNRKRARRLLTESKLYRLYKLEGRTQKEIGKMYGTDTRVVRELLKKYGISTKPLFGGKNRKYKKINLDKFNKINNKDLAYVLGYLAWAGSFQTGDKYGNEFFNLTVSEKDKDYLTRLKKLLGINNKIHYGLSRVDNKEWGRYMIIISQKGIKKAFSKWYYRDQVDTKKFPPKMPKKYLRFYFQGYFDRHACMPKNSKTGRAADYITMSGPSYKFVKEFQQCLKKNGVKAEALVNNYNNQKSTFRVRIVTIDMIDFHEFIYQGCYEKGTRRKNELVEAISYWKTRKDGILAAKAASRKLSKNKTWVRSMREDKGITMKEVAKKLGVTQSQVSSFCSKHGIGSLPRAERSRRRLLKNLEQIKHLLEVEGLSFGEVAKKFHTSDILFKKFAKQYGLRSATAGERYERKLLENIDLIRDLRENKRYQLAVLCYKFKVPMKTLCEFLDKYNIKKPYVEDYFSEIDPN